MAVNDTVRGLKGTITKQKEEIAVLEASLEVANGAAAQYQEENDALHKQIGYLERDLKRADEAVGAHKARADDLQRQLDHSRQSRDEAWARMKVAELEQARLNGYIQRVAEDDAAREGNVEVADSRSVPRRPSPPLSYPSNYAGGTYMTEATDRPGYSNGARRY